MFHSSLFFAIAFPTLTAATGGVRGWNSYDDDASGPGINETRFLESCAYMSNTLLPFGYSLATIDGGWYSPTDLDAFGRPIPNPTLFPSSAGGQGFAPLASKVHALGLTFGVWSIRGIPRSAVAAKTPIWNSSYTADQAARLDQNCSWDSMHYGVLNNEAGRAYYASLAALWGGWGIQYVKIDCMIGDAHSPQHDGIYYEDLTAFATEFKAAGIAVSTSPGASMNPSNATYLAENSFAVAYRISQDLWDRWLDHPFYPTGVKSKLSTFPLYAPLIGVNGAFPDGDMLPLGTIFHNDLPSGSIYGPPSPTHLTRDEQLTVMTLWCVTRAPLILGGQLPLDPEDSWTLGLLTNPEVLAVQNASQGNTPIAVGGGGGAMDQHAWVAHPEGSGPPSSSTAYVALFNGGDGTAAVQVATADAGLPTGGKFCVRDLWARSTLPGGPIGVNFSVTLPPHGAGLYLLSPYPCA